MVGYKNSATVSVNIPRPVILYSDMGFQDWKDTFLQLKNQSTKSTEKESYDKCLKTLMWAEFCNGTISYIGNSKDKYGLTVKFTFQFTSFTCMVLFRKYWKHHLDLVSMK